MLALLAALSCAQVGDLEICGEDYSAPSHGGEEFVLSAHYTVENLGDKPVTFEVTDFNVVDPDWNRTPLKLRETKTIAPKQMIELRLHGTGSIDKLRYHVTYHHEARFRVGTADVVVEAGRLYFRHPRFTGRRRDR